MSCFLLFVKISIQYLNYKPSAVIRQNTGEFSIVDRLKKIFKSSTDTNPQSSSLCLVFYYILRNSIRIGTVNELSKKCIKYRKDYCPILITQEGFKSWRPLNTKRSGRVWLNPDPNILVTLYPLTRRYWKPQLSIFRDVKDGT